MAIGVEGLLFTDLETRCSSFAPRCRKNSQGSFKLCVRDRHGNKNREFYISVFFFMTCKRLQTETQWQQFKYQKNQMKKMSNELKQAIKHVQGPGESEGIENSQQHSSGLQKNV